MQKPTFDILDISQVDGKQKLDIFKDNIITAKQTDLVTLLGGDGSYNAWAGDSATYIVLDDGTIHHYCREEKFIGIRPIVPFNEIAGGISKRYINEDGILEVEYGFYPQTLSPDKWHYYDMKRVSKMGLNVYRPNEANELREYEDLDEDGRYVVFYTHNGNKYIKLSDGSTVETEKAYSIQVEPIKWLIDEKSGLAISKYILSYEKIYNTKRFLRDFGNEITQVKPQHHVIDDNFMIIPTTNQRTLEVAKILTEIGKYRKYYHGKVNIEDRINSLIESHNARIKNKNVGLSLENNDKNTSYLNLINDLNEILTSLKINYENNKVYHDILEYINSCLAIIDGKKRETKTELEKDLMTIVKVIIPTLNNPTELNRISQIFLDIKTYIMEVLENIDNLNGKANGKYKTVTDFELAVRKELQKYLLSIYRELNERALAKEIFDNCQSIMESTYETSKSSIVKVYLDEVHKLSTFIKKNGNETDIGALNEIISGIQEDANLNRTIDYLIEIIKNLYMIQLDIMEGLTEQRQLTEYTIEISKVRVKQKETI